nr:PilZ domain-containing protein [Ureibacillus xyleni]
MVTYNPEYSKPSVPFERRKYFRFEFQNPLSGEMTISEVNGKKVQVGKTPILIDNIGLGGLKIRSNLKSPINMNMKFRICFSLLNEQFEVDCQLKWTNEEFLDIYSYGIYFKLSRITQDRLALIINKLSALRRNNLTIPDTEFIYEDPRTYFRNNLLEKIK